MAQTIDANRLLELVLHLDAPLMTLIANRLYPGVLDTPAGMTAPGKALQFVGEGAAGNPDTPAAEQRFTFYCFGEHQAAAQAVYAALNDALHRRGTTRVTESGKTWLWRFGERELGPRDWPEPLTGWPRVIAAYRVYYNEVAIT